MCLTVGPVLRRICALRNTGRTASVYCISFKKSNETCVESQARYTRLICNKKPGHSSPVCSWMRLAVFGSSGCLHPLDQEVEIRGGEFGLLVGEQSQRSILHCFHRFDHSRHWNSEAVVHLPCPNQSNVLNHLRASRENAIGHKP